jgi:hypothetical protein
MKESSSEPTKDDGRAGKPCCRSRGFRSVIVRRDDGWRVEQSLMKTLSFLPSFRLGCTGGWCAVKTLWFRWPMARGRRRRS